MSATCRVAAVDLGATSGRVMVARVGAELLELEQLARFDNVPLTTPDGLHWDISGLYQRVLDGLAAAASGGKLDSIGVDSWAVDYGLLAGGELLNEPWNYRDVRTARGVAALHAQLDFEQLFARNGLQFLPFTTAYQLAAESSLVMGRAERLLLLPDLIGYWLCGAQVAERTNASTTGLLGFDGAGWDAGLVELLGLPDGLLAPLVDAGTVLGPLLPSVAERVGSHAPVVTVGSHDTASAVVAVPMQPGAAYISCGTWGLVGVETDAPVLTDEVREAGFTNEGGVDGRTRLLTNVMGLWILSQCVHTWGAQGEAVWLPQLLDAAAQVRGPIAVFDVDDERFVAPGNHPERIVEWFTERGERAPQSRAEFVAVIIESLATAFAAAVDRAGLISGLPADTIHLVGGGAQNDLLCQRTADLSGRPVVAGPVEATALGNALVQARAVGALDGSVEDLRALVARTQPLRSYRPC